MNPLVGSSMTSKSILLASTLNSFWRDIRYYYDSPTVMYICKSMTHKASTSTGDNWQIWKVTLNASDDVTRTEGPIVGNADNRADLGWG